MTANNQARFGDDYPSDIRTIDGIEYLDTHPDDMDLSSVQPPETTSQNAADWTYRGRFMKGKELEYEATLQAYRDIYEGKSNNHTQALMGCRTFASLRRDLNSGDVKVFGDSCRDRWCPMCSGQKAAYAKDQTKIYVQSLKAPRFLTLTLRHNEADLKTQVSFLQQSFARLRQRAYWKEKVTGGIWFLQVKRGKNSGLWHPHLHILIDGSYIEQGRLSALWELVTFGSPVIDIRRLHDVEKTASYVARYTARPAELADMPPADRVEVIEALFGKRLCGTFGTGKTVTLSPPKIESDAEWDYIGSYDDIAEKAQTDLVARAIFRAYNNYEPISAELYKEFTGHLPGHQPIVKERPPVAKQLWLDFFT